MLQVIGYDGHIGSAVTCRGRLRIPSRHGKTSAMLTLLRMAHGGWHACSPGIRTCLRIRLASCLRPRPSSSSSEFPAKPRTKDEGRGRARGNHTFFRHALSRFPASQPAKAGTTNGQNERPTADIKLPGRQVTSVSFCGRDVGARGVWLSHRLEQGADLWIPLTTPKTFALGETGLRGPGGGGIPTPAQLCSLSWPLISEAHGRGCIEAAAVPSPMPGR